MLNSDVVLAKGFGEPVDSVGFSTRPDRGIQQREGRKGDPDGFNWHFRVCTDNCDSEVFQVTKRRGRMFLPIIANRRGCEAQIFQINLQPGPARTKGVACAPWWLRGCYKSPIHTRTYSTFGTQANGGG